MLRVVNGIKDAFVVSNSNETYIFRFNKTPMS